MKDAFKYGYIKDGQDKRDYKLPKSEASSLPVQVDLRKQCPPIYDQGYTGSCTSNAIAAAIDFSRKSANKDLLLPSRLFIYYNGRAIDGNEGEDSGLGIRSGLKGATKLGACKEVTWPYIESKLTIRPSDSCYDEALDYQILSYERIDNTDLHSLKVCLAENKLIIFGFSVYSSFKSNEVSRTGIVPMPGFFERVRGGHAMTIVGYDDIDENFIVRNSYGKSWGMRGYGLMPYRYIESTHLCQDFWVINLTE